MTKVVNDGDCSKLRFILFSLDVKYGSKIDARSGSFWQTENGGHGATRLVCARGRRPRGRFAPTNKCIHKEHPAKTIQPVISGCYRIFSIIYIQRRRHWFSPGGWLIWRVSQRTPIKHWSLRIWPIIFSRHLIHKSTRISFSINARARNNGSDKETEPADCLGAGSGDVRKFYSEPEPTQMCTAPNASLRVENNSMLFLLPKYYLNKRINTVHHFYGITIVF